ncbi:MAG: hypothetical protein ABSB35_30905 [Bryobacteraceae bacterium]
MLVLLNGKGSQHEAQMTAPSNSEGVRPLRKCNNGTKVFLEIDEIPLRSILWVHTAI